MNSRDRGMGNVGGGGGGGSFWDRQYSFQVGDNQYGFNGLTIAIVLIGIALTIGRGTVSNIISSQAWMQIIIVVFSIATTRELIHRSGGSFSKAIGLLVMIYILMNISRWFWSEYVWEFLGGTDVSNAQQYMNEAWDADILDTSDVPAIPGVSDSIDDALSGVTGGTTFTAPPATGGEVTTPQGGAIGGQQGGEGVGGGAPGSPPPAQPAQPVQPSEGTNANFNQAELDRLNGELSEAYGKRNAELFVTVATKIINQFPDHSADAVTLLKELDRQYAMRDNARTLTTTWTRSFVVPEELKKETGEKLSGGSYIIMATGEGTFDMCGSEVATIAYTSPQWLQNHTVRANRCAIDVLYGATEVGDEFTVD